MLPVIELNLQLTYNIAKTKRQQKWVNVPRAIERQKSNLQLHIIARCLAAKLCRADTWPAEFSETVTYHLMTS